MLKKLLRDDFLRHNAIVFIGLMSAGFLNYLVHPVLTRLLTVQDFGEVQALLSLYNNLMVISVFGAVVQNIVSNTDREDPDSVRASAVMITRLRNLALAIAILLVVVIGAASIWFKNFFRFESYWPFLALAPTVLVSMMIVFRRAYLRGILDFKSNAVTDVLIAVGRLLFAAVLAWLGFRAFGVMVGIVISMLCGLWFIYERSRQGFKYVRGAWPRWDADFRREIRFGLLILFISITFTVMTSADMLAVKHFFSPDEAGLYGGIATIARIVMYVSGSVIAVLVPSIRYQQPEEQRRALLRKGLSMTALMAGSVAVAFSLFPKFFIGLLIGPKYLSAAFLLPPLSLLMFSIAILGVFYAYHQALRQNLCAIVGGVGVALALVLTVFHHSTPLVIIQNFLLGAGLSLAIFVGWWLRLLILRRPSYVSIH